MKKIILMFIVVTLISSCTKIENKDTKINPIVQEKIKQEKISFDKIEKNISRLKNIKLSDEDLEFLNSEIENTFNRNIEKEALEKNDYNICDKLDTQNIVNCKRRVVIKNANVNDCEILGNTGSINLCKNEINKNLANKNLDENICDAILDESEEKFEIISCKNEIFRRKAIKNLDTKYCYKISEKMEKEMCIEDVKMEKEIASDNM